MTTPSWSLLNPPRVNREGNQIELDFYISDVGIAPSLRFSTITIPGSGTSNNVGPFVGWRTHQTNLLQFFRGDSNTETKLFSGVVYAIDLPGSDAVVSVAFRLTPTSLLSCGADLRPDTYAAWIQSLGAGLVVLKATSGGSAVSSTTFTFSAGSPAELILGAYASIVGKLPGWVVAGGAPTLLLHCDSYAERAARAASGTTFPPAAIDSWTDLRNSSPSDLVQATGSLQPELSADPTTAPTITFDGDLFERAESTDLTQNACAFGVVFRADAGSGASTQQLIGRWSGSSGTDNSSKWQWRLLYERSGGSPQVHKIKAQFVYNNSGMFFTIATVEATIDAPTAKTIALYRATDSSPTTGEIWVNGVRTATTTTFLPGTNGLATALLTVGGRYDGSAALTDAFAGSIDQCFVYSTPLSDAALSAIHHELARRAGVKLGPVPQSNLTQPYTDANPEPRRRLDRWPVAMINLFGGVHYDDNVLSQNPNWRREDEDREKIVEWFRTRIRRILTASADFDIMINRPQGNYRNDIISAGIFGDTDTVPSVPVIQSFQWEALSGWNDGVDHPGLFSEFALSDHNTRDGRQSGDAPFARRC